MRDRIALFIGNLFAVSIVMFALLAIYTEFWPVDVLKNWTVTVPPGTYSLGQQVTAHVEVDKVRAVKAYAHRNIECKDNNGRFVSYHLTDIAGSTKTGHLSSDIPFKIPTSIPNLPTTCRFSVAAQYKIYPYRSVDEYTFSNEFKLQ